MMPRGKKVGKYATSLDGMDYRTIAATMTRMGHPMTFSNARGIFISGMERLAIAVMKATGDAVTPETALRVARDPQFQSYIGDVLRKIAGHDQ